MPPVAPNVEYQNGLLSVHTNNSTLGSVLNAIRAKTGINFEGAAGGTERVAVSLGPAPPGDVLNGLFLGSRFDYIIIGNLAHPETVILSPRNSNGTATAQNTSAPAAQEDEEDEGNGGEEANSPSEMVPPQAIQPVPRPQPAPTVQQNPSAPKTPEQLLQELQRMRQQQQQRQQNPPQQQPPL